MNPCLIQQLVSGCPEMITVKAEKPLLAGKSMEAAGEAIKLSTVFQAWNSADVWCEERLQLSL